MPHWKKTTLGKLAPHPMTHLTIHITGTNDLSAFLHLWSLHRMVKADRNLKDPGADFLAPSYTTIDTFDFGSSTCTVLRNDGSHPTVLERCEHTWNTCYPDRRPWKDLPLDVQDEWERVFTTFEKLTP